MLQSVTPSEEDAERRLNLQHRLTMAMREGLGQPGLFVIAMGSFACGLYTPSSDMDFSLVVGVNSTGKPQRQKLHADPCPPLPPLRLRASGPR